MLAILVSAFVAGAMPPDDLVVKMLARIASDTVNSRGLVYIQDRREYTVKSTVDRLDKSESTKVRGTGNGFIQRVVSKNGAPIVADEEPFDTDIASLVLKYDFTPVMAPAVSVDGYDCWQIAFKPRANLHDGPDTDDAILNHLAGIVYVDARNHLIRSIHAQLTKPFRRGFLGAGHILAVTLNARLQEWDEQRRVGVRTTTVVNIRYSILFGETSKRIEYLFTNHRWEP